MAKGKTDHRVECFCQSNFLKTTNKAFNKLTPSCDQTISICHHVAMLSVSAITNVFLTNISNIIKVSILPHQPEKHRSSLYNRSGLVVTDKVKQYDQTWVRYKSWYMTTLSIKDVLMFSSKLRADSRRVQRRPLAAINETH